MNWKEFLKPDLKKIIISGVIFATLFYIYLIFFSLITVSSIPLTQICCGQMQRNESLEFFCTDHTNRTGFIFNAENCNKYFAERLQQSYIQQIAWYATMILIIIISYLVSCSVFWIFSRRKERPE